MHDAKDIVDKYRFGVRWPSTGLLAIWHLLRGLEGERPMVQDMPVGDLWEEGASLACGQSLTARNSLFLHGFDFFHKINGRIHYMVRSLRSECEIHGAPLAPRANALARYLARKTIGSHFRLVRIRSP